MPVPQGVQLLLTLGSPLGIRNVVFDRVTPTPGPAGGVWPGAVSRWVNVADPNDVVALRKDLQPLFPHRWGSNRSMTVWSTSVGSVTTRSARISMPRKPAAPSRRCCDRDQPRGRGAR